MKTSPASNAGSARPQSLILGKQFGTEKHAEGFVLDGTLVGTDLQLKWCTTAGTGERRRAGEGERACIQILPLCEVLHTLSWLVVPSTQVWLRKACI